MANKTEDPIDYNAEWNEQHEKYLLNGLTSYML